MESQRAWVSGVKLLRLGRYCRMRPLVISDEPRSHEWWGVAKKKRA